ncbi:MAG: delta 1-pyrroline-5-carboxylate synthetase, partial [Gammaproteobacteria bacterium]
MIVVKLGGSRYNTSELKTWLNALDQYAKLQPIII